MEKIRQMLSEEPDDEFLQYAWAMELDSAGDPAQSLLWFQKLMARRPPHVASFFRAAQIHARIGDRAAAVETLRAGIDEARRQNDGHTADEMSQMLDALASTADDI
jgi:hypothetical protein